MGFARILANASTWVYLRWVFLVRVIVWCTPELRFSSSSIS